MSDEEDQVEVLELDEIYADLVGLWEVSQELGVPITSVRRWVEKRASTGAPAPVRPLHMGGVYSMHEWRAWWALWRITRGSNVYTRMAQRE